jgi:flagellar protein FlaF
VQKTTQSGRELEASVLTKAALVLQQVQNTWNAEDRDMRLDEAVRYNQKIWSIFQSELSKPDNPLPKKLREDILSLSLFMDKRIFEVLSFPAPEKLTALININLNLAAGLRGSP